MKRLYAVALPIVALGLAACGSSSSSAPAAASSTPAASGGAVAVTIQSLAFSPTVIHAKVGDTVKWTNSDTPPHNVTYVSGPSFTSSSTLSSGATFSIKLTKAGTINYFCTLHPFMKAQIIVAP